MLYFLCTLISNTNWPSLKWHKAFQQISEIAVNLPPPPPPPPWHVVGKKHTNSHANKWIELLFICLVSDTASEFHLRSAKKKIKKKTITAFTSQPATDCFSSRIHLRLKLEWGLVLLTICPIRCSAVSDQSRFSVASIFSHFMGTCSSINVMEKFSRIRHKDSTDWVKFAVHCIKFVTTNFQSLCPNLSESKPTMP